MSAEVARRLCGVVVVSGLSVVGCSELIDPQAEAALEYRFPSEGAVALAGGPCSGYVCDVEEEDPRTGETVCVCELPGFGTGPPPPPPESVWPEYPPPPPSWVSDIGGGGYPDGGDSEVCDPTADDPPCFEFEARLACPARIVRGCRFSKFRDTLIWGAVKKHEKQHWENGRTELMKPGNNLYIETEDCVGPFSALDNTFDKCLVEEHVRVQRRLRAAAAPEPDELGQIFWAGAGNRWWIWLSDCVSGSCRNEFGWTQRKF